jgi:phospholipase A1
MAKINQQSGNRRREMRLKSKINYYGALSAGIFLTAFFGELICHGAAIAADSAPDKTSVQDCLLMALETAPDGTTIDELRAQCQAEKLTSADEIDEGLLATRIYPDDENVMRPFTLMSHRANYFLMACYNKSPNNDPWREGSGDYNLNLDTVESQFQISIKMPLAVDLFENRVDIFGGYTVRSYWQVYNKDLSAFFRETNYSPEVWLQIRNEWSFWGIKNTVNGFGFVHQSNGRNEPISRSWNRLFATFVFEKGNLVFSIKPWYRIPEDKEDDNNPDLTDYMGHCEIVAAYKWNRNTFTVMSRNNLESGFDKGAVEATWSFPLGNYKYLKGYIQGFTGYGQSLIDYNSNESSVGIGFAITDFL